MRNSIGVYTSMPRKSLLFTAILLILTGCAAKMRKPLPICPGKESVAEALVALQLQSLNMTSLYAKGKSRLQYYDDKGKKHKENLTIRFSVKSSDEIYLRGDMSIVPKAVILGTNKNEFWLAVKPKEISTYWWGTWSELDSSEGLLINPKTLLEALGITKIDIGADWSLSNEGPFDVLTQQDKGVLIKKIYIYCCNYTTRKIEHFNTDGRILARVEMEEYKNVTEKFSVPSRIVVTTFGGDKKEDSFSIKFDFNSIRQQEFTEKQSSLFEPFPRQGFKYVLKLVNGRWVEQSQ